MTALISILLLLAQADPRLPTMVPEAPYSGSAACKSCHPKEYSSWERTYHRTMTQVATPENVAGSFDGTTVRSGELLYRIYKEGSQLMAEMPDPDLMMYVVQGGRKMALTDIPQVKRPVVMSTGSHHYQTYWVASERYEGLLQTLPLVYLLEDKRWAPREQAFLRGPADQGRFVTQWNHHCIRCHSTAGNPGLDEKGMLRTKVAELGISCEACHGPAAEHVRKQQAVSQKADSAPAQEDRSIINPARLDHRRSSQVCGQCHGNYVMRDEYAMRVAREGLLYRPGEDLHKTRYYMQHANFDSSPESAADLKRNPEFYRERWWDDGTILAGGREYTALMASACYQKGEMSCTSCHSMHKSDPVDQLKPGGDAASACTTCHKEAKYNAEISTHTFHRAASEGSNCLNCHMPYTSYALFSAIRSHQISSPRVEPSSRYGTPNACNLCHLDKTLAWTQDSLSKQFGQKPVDLTEEQQKVSAALLWLLKGNAAQRVIAAWHVGWRPAQAASGNDWLAPFDLQLLRDPYGVVRYVAHKSLKTLPGFGGFEFDFLGSSDYLTERARAATRIWKPTIRTNGSSAVLLTRDGKIQIDPLAKLLKERDNRSVTIQE